MTDEHTTPPEFDLDEFLKTRRSGFKLPNAMVVEIKEVLLTLDVDTEEAVLGVGDDVVFEALDEKGSGSAKAIRTLYKKWLLDVSSATKEVKMSDAGKALAHGGPPESVSFKSFEPLYVSAPKHPELEADKIKMNLAEGEITALALSIETGCVHTPADVAGVSYGEDPKASGLVKERRKADMESLSKYLKEKDAGGVLRHFTNLVRDLTSAGMSNQVACVTAFLMEMQTLFETDRKAMLEYLVAYLRQYRGRAFPVKFDFALYAQATATSKLAGGGLTDDQKDQLKMVKQMKTQIESLTSKCQSMADSMKTMRDRQSPFGRQGGAGDKTCNHCGVKGHFAASCKLNPESSNYDPAFAAKKAKDKAAEDDE